MDTSDNTLKATIAEENAISDMLIKKFEALDSYSKEDAEVLSRRLGELMVLSKNLYTKLLPELMNADISNSDEMWTQFTGIRMHLTYMRDCIEDYDAALLELMQDSADEESCSDNE